MATIREIPVGYTLLNGRTGVNIYHFASTGFTADDQCDALGDLMETLDSNLVPGTIWRIPSEGRQLDSATGELVSAWTATTFRTGDGGAAGQPVADATQVLLRWQTAAIRRGRFLRGRTYVPGLNNGYTTAGNVSSALGSTWATAIGAFLDREVGFGVWGRPLPAKGASPAAPGVFALATGGGVWAELAVQRGRRG